MSADSRPAAHLSLAAVVVVWAGAFASIKALLEHGTSPEDVALLRYLVAAPGFAALLWLARGLPGLRRGDALRIAAAGVLVVAGYHLSLNVGSRSTTAGTAALVVALAPSLTLGLSAAVGLERLTAARGLGLAIAFAGVAIVILLGAGEDLSLENARGPLIVLGAPLSFALYNVILRPLLGRYGVLPLTAATSLAGTVALLPFVRPATVEGLARMPARDLALVVYLGVVCTFLGYVAWNVGLRGLGPTRAVAYAYGIPPLAVVIGALTLAEPVTAWLVAGGVLVVAGVALAQRPTRRDRDARIAPGPALAPEES
ncbi:MAG TPA: DMT family transporter [Gaiellaceae bacterium]|nr:DMT family transporter [Gaiellaceae bacterium]